MLGYINDRGRQISAAIPEIGLLRVISMLTWMRIRVRLDGCLGSLLTDMLLDPNLTRWNSPWPKNRLVRHR